MAKDQAQTPAEQLEGLIARMVRQGKAAPAGQRQLSGYLDLWRELGPRFTTVPAARTHHHWWPGGLVQHTLQVIELATAMNENLAANYGAPRLPWWQVVEVAFVHDLDRIVTLRWRAESMGAGPFADHAVDALAGDALTGEDITLAILAHYRILPAPTAPMADPAFLNALRCAHLGYSEYLRMYPQLEAGQLARLLGLADQISSQLLGGKVRGQAGTESPPSPEQQRIHTTELALGELGKAVAELRAQIDTLGEVLAEEDGIALAELIAPAGALAADDPCVLAGMVPEQHGAATMRRIVGLTRRTPETKQ